MKRKPITKRQLETALIQTNYDPEETAKILKRTRQGVLYLMQKYKTEIGVVKYIK